MTDRSGRRTFAEEFQVFLDEFVGPDKRFATKSDLARAAGVSKSNLTRYLKREQARQPRAGILSMLSRTVGNPDDYLYNLWAYCEGLSETRPGAKRAGREEDEGEEAEGGRKGDIERAGKAQGGSAGKGPGQRMGEDAKEHAGEDLWLDAGEGARVRTGKGPGPGVGEDAGDDARKGEGEDAGKGAKSRAGEAGGEAANREDVGSVEDSGEGGGTTARRIPVILPEEIRSSNWEIAEAASRTDRSAAGDSDDPNAFFIVAAGRLMTGMLSPQESVSEGDLLLVEPGGAAAEGGTVVARDADGEATVRKYRLFGRRVHLVPLRDDLPPIVGGILGTRSRSQRRNRVMSPEFSRGAVQYFPVREIRKRI